MIVHFIIEGYCFESEGRLFANVWRTVGIGRNMNAIKMTDGYSSYDFITNSDIMRLVEKNNKYEVYIDVDIEYINKEELRTKLGIKANKHIHSLFLDTYNHICMLIGMSTAAYETLIRYASNIIMHINEDELNISKECTANAMFRILYINGKANIYIIDKH